jgi:hypothetical protein
MSTSSANPSGSNPPSPSAPVDPQSTGIQRPPQEKVIDGTGKEIEMTGSQDRVDVGKDGKQYRVNPQAAVPAGFDDEGLSVAGREERDRKHREMEQQPQADLLDAARAVIVELKDSPKHARLDNAYNHLRRAVRAELGIGPLEPDPIERRALGGSVDTRPPDARDERRKTEGHTAGSPAENRVMPGTQAHTDLENSRLSASTPGAPYPGAPAGANQGNPAVPQYQRPMDTAPPEGQTVNSARPNVAAEAPRVAQSGSSQPVEPSPSAPNVSGKVRE